MVKSGDNLPWLENEVFLELSESHSPSPESTRVNSFSSLDFPDSSLSSGISSKHDKSRDLRHDPWGLGGYTILGIYHHSVVDLDIWFTKSLFSLLVLYWDCIASECVRVRAHDPIVVTTFHLVQTQVLCSGALQCLHPVSAAAGLQCLHGHIVQLQQCWLSSCHPASERNGIVLIYILMCTVLKIAANTFSPIAIISSIYLQVLLTKWDISMLGQQSVS